MPFASFQVWLMLFQGHMEAIADLFRPLASILMVDELVFS